MTSPQPVPQRTEVQLIAASDVVPGPDGRPWVVLTLRLALSVHQLLLPESLAEQAGALIAAKLTEGAAAARRARLGILLPGDQMPPGPNGGQIPLPRLPGVAG